MELIKCNNPQKDSIAAFDTLCTNPQIQLLKILLPFISPSMQGHIALYIKFMELHYTMQLLKSRKNLCFYRGVPDINQIYQEAEPYLPLQDRAKLKSMKDMMDNFNNMKEMMDMVNSMKDMFPDGFDMSSMGDMAGMGGMENIFDMMNQFGGMNGTESESESNSENKTGMDE